MTEAEKLLSLYSFFTPQQRESVQARFSELVAAYPGKHSQVGGFADLWLTAIADIRDGTSPWLP